MKYIIIAIFSILIILTLTKKETRLMTLTNNDTILALGDSLTYGFGAKVDESYPHRLSILSNQKIINAGVNGDTSSEGLQRLPHLLEDKSIKLMILCFGGNDIMQKRSMSILKQNLKTMIQMAKAKDIEVLLISAPNVSLFGLSPLGLYEEVAEDILSQPSLKNDQIHPNALGYKKMAELIYESLKENQWIE
jgi:lysophospholipase L1-like esterase